MPSTFWSRTALARDFRSASFLPDPLNSAAYGKRLLNQLKRIYSKTSPSQLYIRRTIDRPCRSRSDFKFTPHCASIGRPNHRVTFIVCTRRISTQFSRGIRRLQVELLHKMATRDIYQTTVLAQLEKGLQPFSSSSWQVNQAAC